MSTLREKLETATGFGRKKKTQMYFDGNDGPEIRGCEKENARLAPILKALIDALEGYDKLLAHLVPYNKDGEMSYAVTVINETLERLEKAVGK